MRKMYYMFKDEKRRDRLRTSNITLRVFWIMSIVSVIVCGVLWGGAFAAWLLATILFAWTSGYASFNYSVWDFMKYTLWAMLGAIILFAVIYVVRFIIEWIAVLAESRELKKQPEENRIYLDIARIVKRAKIANLIAFAIVVAAVIAVSSIVQGTNADQDKTVAIILIASALAMFIACKIFAAVQFKRVKPQLTERKAYYAEIDRQKKALEQQNKELKEQEKRLKAQK